MTFLDTLRNIVIDFYGTLINTVNKSVQIFIAMYALIIYKTKDNNEEY